MANPWFRMYSEFATDSKVQSMPEPMQRRLLMLMCLRCSNVLATLQDDEIAFALRITDADLTETKALFLRKKFIDEGWRLLNWDKRQFASDSSTARSRKHREENATVKKRSRNVAATPPDTDTDSQEKKVSSKPAVAVDLPDWLSAELWQTWHDHRCATGKRKDWTPHAQSLALAKLTRLRAKGHDPTAVIEQSIECGWTGLFDLKSGDSRGTHFGNRESLNDRAERKLREGDERERAAG